MEGLITATNLANITASGVQTRIVDQTQRPLILPQGQVRLVPGFSKFGAFNRPVLFETGDSVGIEQIYGSRDRSLERKGSFFHYSLMSMIDSGAIIGLNLLKTDDTLDEFGNPTTTSDTAQYKAFSLSPSDDNGNTTLKLYSSYFNKERFWVPDEEFLLATRSTIDDGRLFNLTNLGQRDVSFIVRKASVSGFDVTVSEWYSNTDIPAFLRPYDLISDYFIDVYVIQGNFSDYETLSLDPVLGQYFDERGLIADKIDAFLNADEVNTLRYFQGSLIPNFTDSDGTIKSIDKIINTGVDFHNILCAFDMGEYDKFEDGNNTYGLDMVGHSLIDTVKTELKFLSYLRDVDKNFQYTLKRDYSFFSFASGAGLAITPNVGSFTVQIDNTHGDFTTALNNLEDGDVVKGETTVAGINAGIIYTNPNLVVSQTAKTTTTVTFTLTNQLKEAESGVTGSFVDVDLGATVAETVAGADFDITAAGAITDTVTAYVNNGVEQLQIGTFTLVGGDTPTSIATGLEADIASGVGTHGYGSTPTAANIALTAPVGSGALANDFVLIIIATGTTTATINNQFANGVQATTAGMAVDFDNDDFYIDSTNNKYIAEPASTVYSDFLAGKVQDSDIIKSATGDLYMKFTQTRDAVLFDLLLEVELYTDAALTVLANTTVGGGDSFNSDGFAITTASSINFISSLSDLSTKFPILGVVDNKTVRVDVAYTDDIKIGQYLVGFDDDNNKILTRIVGVKNIGSPIVTEIEVTTDRAINITTALNGDSQIERFLPLPSAFDRFQIFAMAGLVINESHQPNGTNARMKEIYGVMTDTAIAKAIVDPDFITFRYLVDTFNNGLETQSKSYLTSMIKTRSKALALLNTPSTKEFGDSTSPSFRDAPTPTNPLPPIEAKYIADGGNPVMNPDFLYTRPEEINGASHSMFFYPNLVKRELDGSYTSVPPASHVSNNFAVKWNTGNGFKATAGINRGVINDSSIISLDHILDLDDRGELESKGINPLRQKDGTIMVYGNQTAYHKFKSILNQGNSRDTLITMEIDIENILENFIFESAFEDDIIRTTITTSLENYLDGLRDTFSAINSYVVKFDRENNPDWVIAEQTAIVDIEVALPYVTRKFIARVTLAGNNATVGSFSAV